MQHALRAFTPRDQKAVAAAAQTFRPNPKLDTAQVIMELGKGEALVSFLEGNGTPAMVERVMIRPPTARIGPITPEERKAIMDSEPGEGQIRHHHRFRIRLRGAAEARGRDRGDGAAAAAAAFSDRSASIVGTIFGTNVSRGKMSTGQVIARNVTRSVTNKVVGGVVADLGKSVGGSIGGSIGRAMVRGALGGLLRR